MASPTAEQEAAEKSGRILKNALKAAREYMEFGKVLTTTWSEADACGVDGIVRLDGNTKCIAARYREYREGCETATIRDTEYDNLLTGRNQPDLMVFSLVSTGSELPYATLLIRPSEMRTAATRLQSRFGWGRSKRGDGIGSYKDTNGRGREFWAFTFDSIASTGVPCTILYIDWSSRALFSGAGDTVARHCNGGLVTPHRIEWDIKPVRPSLYLKEQLCFPNGVSVLRTHAGQVGPTEKRCPECGVVRPLHAFTKYFEVVFDKSREYFTLYLCDTDSPSLPCDKCDPPKVAVPYREASEFGAVRHWTATEHGSRHAAWCNRSYGRGVTLRQDTACARYRDRRVEPVGRTA